MKKSTAISTVIMLLGAAQLAHAGWYFENAGRTAITNDAGWRFTVSANTTAKSVSIGQNACTQSPLAATVLDLSGGVSDDVNATGDTYHIVSVGTSTSSILGAAASAHIPKASGLVLPNTLTNIANYAFNACTNFTGNLAIPDTVRNIGQYAFQNCHFGGSLVIGDGVTNIGTSAFNGCTFSGSVTFGAGYVDFGNTIFCRTTFDVPVLFFPDTVKNIGNAFYNSSSSANRATFVNTSLVIGNGVTNIAAYAFGSAITGLTGTLTLGTNLVTIGNSAFQGGAFTGSLVIPDSVSRIGDYAFQGVPFGGSLHIGNGVTSIGTYAFQHCTFTGQPYFGISLETIGNNAFNSTKFIAADPLVIPDTVRHIGNSAFLSATFSGTVFIGNGVTNIGANAFQSLGLTRVSTPSTGVSFGNYAFYISSATPFNAIYFRGDYPASVGSSLYNTSIHTSYVAQVSVADWETKTGLNISGGAASWNNKPIRVGACEDVPGIVWFDFCGGYGGSPYAHVQSGEHLPAGIIAPQRDNQTFLGYYDITGTLQYLNGDMTSTRLWNLPTGSKLYAQWHDLEPADFQSIQIAFIEVLPDGDVLLSWYRDRVKFEYNQEPYTLFVHASDDLVNWATLTESTDYSLITATNPLRLHKARVTPSNGATKGFFKIWAEREAP